MREKNTVFGLGHKADSTYLKNRGHGRMNGESATLASVGRQKTDPGELHSA